MLAGAATVSNWPRISSAQSYQRLLDLGQSLNMSLQRLALWNRPLAPEYPRSRISRNHPSWGGFGAVYIDPDPGYQQMLQDGFRSWRLEVKGLVQRPLSLALDQLRTLPSRSQITMHSCDEGWSAIAEWTGVQLSHVLNMAGLLPNARFVVFRCMDSINREHIWGSLDLLDAYHPQTLLAHGMNGAHLPARHGAPLRLRIELQVGYKNLKHIQQVTVVETLQDIGAGRGGLFEEMGYQWYAGL